MTSSQLMANYLIKAHGELSYSRLMIQAHEFHWGNLGSRNLEGQEVYSVKFHILKLIKETCYLA